MNMPALPWNKQLRDRIKKYDAVRRIRDMPARAVLYPVDLAKMVEIDITPWANKSDEYRNLVWLWIAKLERMLDTPLWQFHIVLARPTRVDEHGNPRQAGTGKPCIKLIGAEAYKWKADQITARKLLDIEHQNALLRRLVKDYEVLFPHATPRQIARLHARIKTELDKAKAEAEGTLGSFDDVLGDHAPDNLPFSPMTQRLHAGRLARPRRKSRRR